MSTLERNISRQINFLITRKMKQPAGEREPFTQGRIGERARRRPSDVQIFPQNTQGSRPDGPDWALLAGCSLPPRAENVCSSWRTLNRPCYQISTMLSCSPSTSPAWPRRSLTLRRQRLWQIPPPLQPGLFCCGTFLSTVSVPHPRL